MTVTAKRNEAGQFQGIVSLYDPAHCDAIIQLLAQGYSQGAAAAQIGVTKATLHNWAKQHPEFAEALQMGNLLSQLWWENLYRDAAKGGDGNPRLLEFGLRNRGREDWADLQKQEISGPGGGPLEVGVTKVMREIVDPKN